MGIEALRLISMVLLGRNDLLFIILAILLGIVLGLFLPVPSDEALSLYFVVGIFASLDAVLGAIRSNLENKYDSKIFLSGFILNTIVAMILAYLGDKLSLPLYYAAIFVFGTRIFSNISIIRRVLIKVRKFDKKVKKIYTRKHERRILYYSSIKKRKKH